MLLVWESEKQKLEKDFSIIELDLAIKNANMNSAAGIDGLSTRFIAKFWRIFLYRFLGMRPAVSGRDLFVQLLNLPQ